MARRSDHTREELKNLAIQAGYNILKTEGSAEFSARKVARSIGYTVGTLYNVFGSYENLMLHIQGAILDDWFHALQNSLGKSDGAKPLHSLASFYIAYGKKNYASWSVLFERPATNKDEMPEWYREKLARFFEVVEGLVLPVVKGDTKQAAHAARLLWASIHGICVLTLSGKLDLLAEESAEVIAHRLIDNYLKGLASDD